MAVRTRWGFPESCRSISRAWVMSVGLLRMVSSRATVVSEPKTRALGCSEAMASAFRWALVSTRSCGLRLSPCSSTSGERMRNFQPSAARSSRRRGEPEARMNSVGRVIVGSGEWGVESGRQAGKMTFCGLVWVVQSVDRADLFEGSLGRSSQT